MNKKNKTKITALIFNKFSTCRQQEISVIWIYEDYTSVQKNVSVWIYI